MAEHVDNGQMRSFGTGATRDTSVNKLDYEAYLSPLVLERYAQYMLSHQVQPDGAIRPGDNWQKGIPFEAYMKSGFRHFVDWWKIHRDLPAEQDLENSLCALIFNAMGYLHEFLKEKEKCEKLKAMTALPPEQGIES